MPFDDATRNRLQGFVTAVRRLLAEEFTRQLQEDYGLDPGSGEATQLEQLPALDDRRLETARILREIAAHYLAAEPVTGKDARCIVLDRIVREQAFTVLNRLAALRMMEARGILIACVAQGYQSQGFQLYQRVAASALGETGETYRVFLMSLFDAFAPDLPALFDRHAPQGRLFPREPALLAVLKEFDAPDLEPLWAEDETIGWIYQYFNSKEERRAMRDASPAPRNSRELAVRNQFFTPRYVVEFLVDNTLGRLWFNWTGGVTGLRDRCQYLLVKPDERPEPAPRLRDPRTIKLLDPACGSMHFGLYAFDLFFDIYREAWDWEQAHGPGALDRETGAPKGGAARATMDRVGGNPYRREVEGAADHRREGVPPLLTPPHKGQGNPVGACLVSLTQAYPDEEAFLRDVPRLIVEHNIYGVEIDPRAAQIASLALWLRAQRAWHEAGVKAADRPHVGRGHVVPAVAPPAEPELIDRFKKELDTRDAELFERTLGLLKGLPELGVLLQVEKELPALVRAAYGEHGPIFAAEDRAQWEKAEARLRAALTAFAVAAQSSYQRRLFAEDALQGLTLVDLVRDTFDVAVLNPPFGDPPPRYQRPDGDGSSNNLYAMFVQRMTDLNIPYIGTITDRTFIVQPTFARFRKLLLDGDTKLSALVDLGWGVLDANVQVCAYVLNPSGAASSCTFMDLRGETDKAARLSPLEQTWRQVPNSVFEKFPNNIFAFTVPDSVLDKLGRWRSLASIANLPRGLGSNKAERTFRAWYEVLPADLEPDKRWVSLSNGGDLSPYWRSDMGIADWKTPSGGQWVDMSSSDPWRPYDQSGTADYFRRGLAFPKQSSRFHVSALPSAFVPTREGKAILPHEDSDQFVLMALLNSGVIGAFVRDTCGLHKQSGAIGNVPVPDISAECKSRLTSLAQRVLRASYTSATLDETSRTFVLPDQLSPLVRNIDLLRQEAGAAIQEIEVITKDLFGIRATDEAWLEPHAAPAYFVPTPDDTNSWAVGVAFGRFDWRLTTGEREAPPEPDPFDLLPAKSPGMLPDGAEPFHAHPGILVDDQGHSHDLARLVEEVLARVDCPVPDDVRRWLQRDFFPFHLQRYSKSRRKAPIYWPLSTASGSYTLWVYYPNLSSQTLYTAINDFLEPKLQDLAKQNAALRAKGADRTRDEAKALEILQEFELELIELRDALLRIAPGYRPNHGDGVQITAAPLWPLFRHKPWQKLLKETWDKLEKGDYDWAHLTMAYWPERVHKKCATDKSLAIAHGLEDLYQPPPEAQNRTARRRSRNRGADAS
jgi:hypothetical protein